MEDLGVEAETALKQESAVIESLEELSVDGLKSKMESVFLGWAPPEPRGKGDISVEIDATNLYKTPKQTNEEANLDWYGVKSNIKITFNSGELRETTAIPAIVRSTDYSVYTELLEEQFDENVEELILRVKNMEPEEAQELAPFIEAVIKNILWGVEDIAKNFIL